MKDRKVEVPESYLKDLEKRVQDMQALFEVSSIISSTLDYRELISLVMEKARAVMEAEACSILLYNRDTERLEFQVAMGPEESASATLKEKVSLRMGEGIAGWVAEHEKPLLIKDASKDSRFFSGADHLTGFTTRSMIATPLIGRSGLIGVAEVINPANKESFGDYDVQIMKTFCRQIAIAIENARFYRASIERERFRKELEIASVVQKSFLPESPTISAGSIKARAYNMPALQVGGDIYDFADLGDGRLGVLIGDVSGKGVSAALYMAKIVSDFRFIANMNDSVTDVIEELNRRLMSSRNVPDMYLHDRQRRIGRSSFCQCRTPPVRSCFSFRCEDHRG
jgi:sigma-B regulation protein RsbU (phosphoserine phosphatase)